MDQVLEVRCPIVILHPVTLVPQPVSLNYLTWTQIRLPVHGGRLRSIRVDASSVGLMLREDGAGLLSETLQTPLDAVAVFGARWVGREVGGLQGRGIPGDRLIVLGRLVMKQRLLNLAVVLPQMHVVLRGDRKLVLPMLSS